MNINIKKLIILLITGILFIVSSYIFANLVADNIIVKHWYLSISIISGVVGFITFMFIIIKIITE